MGARGSIELCAIETPGLASASAGRAEESLISDQKQLGALVDHRCKYNCTSIPRKEVEQALQENRAFPISKTISYAIRASSRVIHVFFTVSKR